NIIHGPYPRQSSSSIYVLAALSDIKRFLVKIQEYKSSEEPRIIKELNKSTSTPINVFHTNRIIKPKIIVNKCTNSKLYIHRQSTVSKSSNPMKRKKDENLKTFNRKIVLNLSRKIDYLLSWTMTHSSRLLMLESELQGIEQDLRHQLNQYQRDKNCIEKNLKHIRLQQQTANGSKRIQEL
ncbi:unnamed protein product, partial [Rotaria magnacalcarata]